MKEIRLTQNKVALVDDWEYERINKYKWHATAGGNTYYARRQISRSNFIWMHHLVLPPSPGFETDHRDGKGLNNQRENLRSVTRSQNQMNRKPTPRTSSKYKGIAWDRQVCKWRVRLSLKGICIDLGNFKTEKEAALAYNCLALQHFGEFAQLNIINVPVNREELMNKLIQLEKGELL